MMKSLKKEVKSKIQSRWRPEKGDEKQLGGSSPEKPNSPEKLKNPENKNNNGSPKAEKQNDLDNQAVSLMNRPQSAQMNKQRTPHVGAYTKRLLNEKGVKWMGR